MSVCGRVEGEIVREKASANAKHFEINQKIATNCFDLCHKYFYRAIECQRVCEPSAVAG